MWIVLSREETDLQKRLVIADLFKVNRKKARELWEAVIEAGFLPHPELMQRYYEQLTCIWCGGDIFRFKTSIEDENSWEDRCYDCGFIYAESK